MGFGRDAGAAMERAGREAPGLLAAATSCSSMWTANAATVSPSADTADGRVHLTPANLATNLHRALEAGATTRLLRAIFPDASRFAVHDPLPATTPMHDEGAANHTRLARSHGEPGLELFVYGRAAAWEHEPGGAARGPRRFPARQTLEASQAIARRHGLAPGRALMVQQRAASIDAGVFHNDVIAVGNEGVLLRHELAWEDEGAADEIRAAYRRVTGGELDVVTIAEDELPLDEAVATYLFNSQLVTLPGGGGRMAMVLPEEARASDRARACVERIVAGDNAVVEAHYFDLRQSMRNGGGPACLRLRVALTEDEAAAVAPGAVLDESRIDALEAWVRRRYREELAPADLADPALVGEVRDALDELTGMLGLGAVYPFQG
jgi:succinylarginine dihydrolase